MSRVRFSILCSIVLLTATTTPVWAQTRCTTQWNALIRQYETRCDDGTRATEQYNPLLREWERTITRPPPAFQPPVRCTTRYNALLRQWEEVCR